MSVKSFQQLKSELDAGQLQNLYIFTGDEKEVLRRYIKRVDENAQTVESVSSLWKHLSSKGLFNKGDKTFVLYNDKEITEMKVKEIVRFVGSHTLILVFDSIDKRKTFFKQSESFITVFEKFNEQQLSSIVQSKLKTSDELSQVIAKYSNNEVSRLELEIDKLKHLDAEITLELVNELISAPIEDRIFEMIDSVAKKQKVRAFDLFYDLMEMKESPIKIVSLLYSKFKQVFLVQSYFSLNNAELAGRTGLTFYQVNFARDLAGNFSNDKLIHILKNIQQTEVEMKTGQVDINLGMNALLVEILND
jgi:DNA polymerase III subunit delta